MATLNTFPTASNSTSLAIIGTAPGELELAYQKPFVGPAGRFLHSVLIGLGLNREQVFLGYLSQNEGGKQALADVDRQQYEKDKENLKSDLRMFDPRVVVLLGQQPLKEAGVVHSISAYRGTVFECNDINSIFFSYKCIATYDPGYVLAGNGRDGEVVKADFTRAQRELSFKGIYQPTRTYELGLTPLELVERLEDIERNKTLISFDIEGGVSGVTCCGIATSSTSAFIIPFNYGQQFFFSEREQAQVLAALSRMLENPSVPKILQNSLYDCFVMAWVHKITIRNVREDTMLKHWELYPEMEKSLGFQVSYYTQEPYYKAERGSQTSEGYFTYCCKDAALTYEINEKQTALLSLAPDSVQSHYRFNMRMLRPLLFMELRGIKYHEARAQEKIEKLTEEMNGLQALVNQANGGKPLNVKSPKQMVEFLKRKNLPVPTNRKTGRPTANYTALLSLAKKTGYRFLTQIIGLKTRGTRVQMLNIRADDDGRIRCGYNVVGTDTGRLTCYTSPTGSGYNLQTITEADRDNFLADEDYWFFQCDLSGADAWTVAAWGHSLGDPTMLEDLKAGIKVAKVIACMFRFGGEVTSLPREELVKLTNQIEKTDPIYFASKCVQHGSNYGMGKILMSSIIFTQSEGAVNTSAADCQRLQDLYFRRYPGVKRWQTFVQTRVNNKTVFTSASGHQRRFAGAAGDFGIFKQALANEPQENTTYATNLAALNLWEDEENHRADGSLIIEPLHQVHDALCGQFPKGVTNWAVDKIRGYFNNELIIAGVPITIPYEGAYGPSWGELNQGEIKP